MKLLIVEDDFSVLYLLKRILASKKHEILVAKDGEEALNIISQNPIDVLVTDWMMPKINGMELIQLVRERITPCPVIIVVTALNSKEAKDIALESGADDFITKPFVKEDIIERIERSYQKRKTSLSYTEQSKSSVHYKAKKMLGLGIAASTGGPKTLMTVIKDMGFLEKTAVFVVLHGPSWMLETFAERLQNFTKMNVYIANDKMEISDGCIYIAPGDNHLIIDAKDFLLRVTNDPPENYVRPAADPLFRSIAKTFGKNSIGVVLTGMGRDGSIGAGYISVHNGFVIAQDPIDTVVPSMPQTVIDLNLANKIVRLNEIGFEIRKYIKNFNFD